MAKLKRFRTESAQRIEGAIILPFREIPARKSYFVEEFLAHVKRTGQPETFHGLHLGPLDKNEPFRKIAPIEIEGRRRPDGARAPCPMCHHPNKFLKGWLVYLPNLQAVAAIGCECAGKETLAAADREYRSRRDCEQEENYLLDHLPLVPSQLALVARVQPAAVEALRVHRRFRNTGEPFIRQLRAVKQRGGQLIVSEEITGSTAAVGPRGFQGTNGGNTRDVVFGPLAGTTALIRDYNPVSELNRIAAALCRHDKQSTEELALAYVVTLDSAARHKVYVELTEAAEAYERFRRRLIDFTAFFTPDNIARIQAWASHTAHQPFETSRTAQRGITIVSMRRGNYQFKVTLKDPLRMEIPNWPKA